MPDKEKRGAGTSPAQRQLAEWWAEWTLDQQLREQDASAPGPKDIAIYRSTRYTADAPAEGDIRLLHPAGPAWGPVYVLVLEQCWIPFSRFGVPAFETEWRTGLRSAPLRVLCGWNARHLADNRSPASWRVRRVTDLTLERQRMFFEAIRSGKPLASKWQQQQGPPLRHPADPRHEYRDEEEARLDAHGLALAAPVCIEEEPTTYLDQPAAPGGLWQAAESRPLYGVPVALYRTVDGTVTVAVFAADTGRVRIRLVTRAGLPCDTFDGGTVGAAGQSVTDRIENGVVVAPATITHDLTTLQDAHGRTWRLKKG